MKLVNAGQMKDLEQKTITEYGIDGLLLMENAARGFCDVLEAEWGSVSGKSVAVFCGKGGNGGDGFAISRHLSNRGATVTVVFSEAPECLPTDARTNFNTIHRMGLPILTFSNIKNSAYDIAVDALLGIGFHGTVADKTADCIEKLNHCAQKIASVDVPSGADCSTGAVTGSCVRADLTVTFALPKPGHYLYPAKEFCGKVVVSDISVPKQEIANFPATMFTLDEESVEPLPKRKDNSHKGSFGKVLVFAGSTGMSGACMMTTAAVLKSGAGMVTAAVPDTIADSITARFPEAMTLPLPTREGNLTDAADTMIMEKLKNQTVLLAGCGLGTHEKTQKALLSVLSQWEKPMVIDADGINGLAGHIHIVKNKPVPPILTPHPLEFSRICGLSMEEIQNNRMQIAGEFAAQNNVVLVLKGADTIVAHPNGRLYIATQSNSGLAKAGSGDVLAGIIAALLAQGLSPGSAANLGVYIHSQAGLLAKTRYGAYSMTAGDVINALPDAFCELARATQE